MILANLSKILCIIDNWINDESGWIESIEAEYVNISIYTLLSGSKYIKIPCELKNSMID